MGNAAAAFAVMKDRIGEDQGAGDWFNVSQEQIDRFADVTNDHQFIHVDPERAAAETPFGGTIAHGFLTLSMLVHLQESIETEPMPLDGLMMGINYGFEKVRFITPVPSGARIRRLVCDQERRAERNLGPDHQDHDHRDRRRQETGPGR